MKKIKKKLEKPVIHEQWIEIVTRDGKTVTTFYPPNDEFEKLRQEMNPQPSLIYRRMNFVGGVPEEYSWTLPSSEAKRYGGHCLQRIKTEDWLGVMGRERAGGNRTVEEADNLQPRPAAFGPCPCERCTKLREEEVDAAA